MTQNVIDGYIVRSAILSTSNGIELFLEYIYHIFLPLSLSWLKYFIRFFWLRLWSLMWGINVSNSQIYNGKSLSIISRNYPLMHIAFHFYEQIHTSGEDVLKDDSVSSPFLMFSNSFWRSSCAFLTKFVYSEPWECHFPALVVQKLVVFLVSNKENASHSLSETVLSERLHAFVI